MRKELLEKIKLHCNQVILTIQVKVIAMIKVSIIFSIKEISRKIRFFIRKNRDLMMIKLVERRGIVQGRNNRT